MAYIVVTLEVSKPVTFRALKFLQDANISAIFVTLLVLNEFPNIKDSKFEQSKNMRCILVTLRVSKRLKSNLRAL